MAEEKKKGILAQMFEIFFIHLKEMDSDKAAMVFIAVLLILTFGSVGMVGTITNGLVHILESVTTYVGSSVS